MNRLIFITDKVEPGIPADVLKYLPKVGSEYTIAKAIEHPPHGVWYKLWELPSNLSYHESLFATLSDDQEKATRYEIIPAWQREHEKVLLFAERYGRPLSFDEQGYED